MCTIPFMSEPSSTTVRSERVSNPPSVPVRPMRGMTSTPCASASARIAVTWSALPAWTTAIGKGPS